MWREYYIKLNEKNRRISMNNELEIITKQLQDESHFDIEPFTETTTVDFEEWSLYNENMIHKFNSIYFTIEPTFSQINTKIIIGEYIQKKCNVLGFMISPIAYYYGILLKYTWFNTNKIEIFIEENKDKFLFIYDIKYIPNYPIIIDDKIQLSIDKDYWLIQYATLED